MLEDLTGSARRNNADTARDIKAWVKEFFQMDEDSTVMVGELQCGERDCPDVETVVAILSPGGVTQRFRIARPIEQVTRRDLYSVGHSDWIGLI